jgi:hypothetical protein
MSQFPGQVEIIFEFSRHLGPRFVHGGVTLDFDSLQQHSFSSHAVWPAESYEAAVRSEVEAVLREKLGTLNASRLFSSLLPGIPSTLARLGSGKLREQLHSPHSKCSIRWTPLISNLHGVD